MDWRQTKASILQHRFSNAAVKLGEGEEAEVYALDDSRVVRFLKEPVDVAFADRRRAFYDSLDRADAVFDVPRVLEAVQQDGQCYSIERRMRGTSLAQALPLLEGASRRQALLAYAEAAKAVRRLKSPQRRFGEILASSPIRSETWPAFLLARAEACLSTNRSRVADLGENADRALVHLGQMAAQRAAVKPELVHGDYYPANVMIDRTHRVTAVIDFGSLTMIGDAKLDVASAVLYLIGMEGVTADDTQLVQARLQDDGLQDADLALYRLFYAFRFLGAPREGLRRWCVETIRAAA